MRRPTVSIILPTYNRARFLRQAIDSIRRQEFRDWELIVVDDGSMDDTPELFSELATDIQQPLQYIRQENQGAYAARNTGLDHASGKYIAFFDSDDLWLEHHLQKCVEALEHNSDVDWVYGACRLVDAASGDTLCANSFYEHGRSHKFLSLPCERRGDLKVLVARGLVAAILRGAGLYAGLQNSVIRAGVLKDRQFNVEFRNEAEDQIAVIIAAGIGHRFGYFDCVHVLYQIHSENSSGSATEMGYSQRLHLISGLIRGFEDLPARLDLSADERDALRKKLGELYVWQLGYSVLWMGGQRQESLRAIRRGLTYWPWTWRGWKTYALAQARASAPKPLKHIWWYLSVPSYRRQIADANQYKRKQRAAVCQIRNQAGDAILTGPFRGMIYTPARTSKFDAHKLLGTYEKELWQIVDRICRSEYERVINIGAADGYYACGLARCLPDAHVIAFEAWQNLHPAIEEMARANGLSNLELAAMCDVEALRRQLINAGRACVVCDVDGLEEELLDPQAIPELSICDMLIETHDGIVPGITPTLISRFEESHSIEHLTTQQRTLADIPKGVKLEPRLAVAAMDEHRGFEQDWLWMVSKVRALRPERVAT